MKVRIAVAVASNGAWEAAKAEGDARAFLSYPIERGFPFHIVWIEADVPLPPHPTVRGKLVESNT